MSSSSMSSSAAAFTVAASVVPSSACRITCSLPNLISSLRSSTRAFVCFLTTEFSTNDNVYFAAVDVEDIARTANSKANMTIIPGRGCSRRVLTQYRNIRISKASEMTSEVMRRAWKSRGFVGGCCSSASTRASLIHCHTFPAKSPTNMTKNHVPTSSLNVVIARAVSVTAYQALSHNCSRSIARNGP